MGNMKWHALLVLGLMLSLGCAQSERQGIPYLKVGIEKNQPPGNSGVPYPVPKNRAIPENNQLYDIYPDTESAPVLEFFWNGELGPSQVTRITPYGVWENWLVYPDGIAYEPAVEMQFYTTTGRSPIYAVASGTVVYINRTYANAGYLTVRYGRNYSVTYHHLTEIPANIITGAKIEAGDVMGYGEILPTMYDPAIKETWWEIELNAKKGNIVRTVPPFDYFSERSKEKLLKILDNARYWDVDGSPRTWTVSEGCSWIKYLRASEWWGSHERLGYQTERENISDFLNANNLTWKVVENGRVIGPTDKCR